MTRLTLVLITVLTTTTARAAQYTVADGSTVEFLAHITGSTFTATTTSVSGGVETDESGTVTKGLILLKAADFSSGLSMRDSHMREKYLETDKFPLITLDLSGTKLPLNGIGQLDVDGSLEVKGVKKPVKLHVIVVDAGGDRRKATSAFTVDISQYGIAQPKFAVVKMDTKVDITAVIVFARK